MRIVVVGGSGFIGTRLIDELLRAGHQVRNVDKAPSAAHPQCTTIADVRDLTAMRKLLIDCDCIINLAAEHGDNVQPPALYTEVNVEGAGNIVQAAETHACQRLIFVSSAAVYGHRQPLADEDSPLLPDNDYGRSKAAAEAVYGAWVARAPQQRSLTVLRPCVVFGEGNRGNVHTLIDHIRRRRFVMVGTGENHKSIAYVGNLVDFLMLRLDQPPGISIYNYADRPDLRMGELVQQIRSLLGQSDLRLPHVPFRLALALGRVFDALAWLRRRPTAISSERVRKFCSDTRIGSRHAYPRPEVSLAEGLARTVARALEDAGRD